MRIGILAHNSRRVGGVETYLAAAIPALTRAGFEVAALFESAAGPGDPVLPEPSPFRSWVAEHDAAGSLRALAAWQPDVIFVHGLRSLSLERAATRIGPAVAFAHTYYGTCISGSKCFSFPTGAPCDRRFGPACLLQFYPRRCGGLSPLTMAAQYRLMRGRLETLSSYARLVVASHHMAAEYERHGLGHKVRIVGLPVPQADQPRASLNAGGGWRLLFLGRLEATKGVRLLPGIAALVAAAVDGPVAIDIAGEGALRTWLEQHCSRVATAHSNLSIRIHGHLGSEACGQLIAASHLLLVPSCWPEPFGLVGLEAAVLGVPAIAFDVGGIRDWLLDGETGLLVEATPPGARQFAAAVVRCLADPSALRRMGDSARARARSFSLDRHIERLGQVFAEAVLDHGAAR